MGSMWWCQDLNQRPFLLCILFQLSVEFSSWETLLFLILIETWLSWDFTINQVFLMASAPYRKSLCTLPPDNQLEDPERAFDEDEGLLAGSIQWSSIDIHQLITSLHLGQSCLAPIFNLYCREQNRKQEMRRLLIQISTPWLLLTSEPWVVGVAGWWLQEAPSSI